MKAIKYLVAGLLVMGLAAPAMAQDVNYKDMLKPIETTLKAGNADPKAFAKEIKEYQKEFKKDPKALVALGNLLAMNKNYDQANAVADAVIAKFKNYGDAYILKGDIYAMQDNGGEAATWYGQCMTMDPKNPQARSGPAPAPWPAPPRYPPPMRPPYRRSAPRRRRCWR